MHCTETSPDFAFGRHVGGLHPELDEAISRIHEDAMPELMRHTSALLGLAFAAEGFVPPETKSRLAALERIKRFVELHLSNPSLGSQFVAEGTGLSPRYINRLFEREGTSLMRYVLEARLARCRLELEDPRFGALGITEVAMRWGFNNLSHFSRTFHERYGMSPSAWRGVIARSAEIPPGTLGAE
jgi:AraC-like DNA-binding protein